MLKMYSLQNEQFNKFLGLDNDEDPNNPQNHNNNHHNNNNPNLSS